MGITFASSDNWNWVELERITGEKYYVCETEPFNINYSVAVWRIVWEYTPRTDVPEHSTGITINLYAGVSGDDKLLEISRMGIYNGDEDCRYFHKEGVFRLKISSNTQNFTVRIEQSMGYIPDPPTDNWVEVTRFIGSRGFTTDLFMCNHLEWRIRWEYDPGHGHFPELATLQLTTYKEGESASYFNQILEVPNGNVNGIELLNQNGTFYIEISTGIIDSYTIIVEQNIESIPDFPSWTSLPFFLIATVSAIIFKKRLFSQSS